MRINLSSWAKFEISKRLSFKILLSTIEPRLVGVVNVIKVMSCNAFNGPRIKSTLRYRFSGISLKFSHALFLSRVSDLRELKLRYFLIVRITP